MANYHARVTVPSSWGDGWDCGFVPRAWKVRLTVAADGPIEVSFNGFETTPDLAARVGPSTDALPAPGEVELSGKSRIWLKSNAGSEEVDIEAWD